MSLGVSMLIVVIGCMALVGLGFVWGATAGEKDEWEHDEFDEGYEKGFLEGHAEGIRITAVNWSRTRQKAIEVLQAWAASDAHPDLQKVMEAINRRDDLLREYGLRCRAAEHEARRSISPDDKMTIRQAGSGMAEE